MFLCKSAIILSLCAAAGYSADTVSIKPGDDFKAIAESSAEGTIFLVKAGMYRTGDIAFKPHQQIVGELGADGERLSILSGAVLLTNWKKEGKYWVHENVKPCGNNYGNCRPGYSPQCKSPEDLYLDDIFLREASSLADLDTLIWDRSVYPIGAYEQQDINQDIPHGTWYYDIPNKKVYMRDDPTGHTMELSNIESFTRSLTGESGFPLYKDPVCGVTIKNIIVEKYACSAQGAAICGGGKGESCAWLVENVEARLNHAGGISFQGDGPSIMRNCYVHHNGQNGLKFQWCKNGLLEGCEVAYNTMHRTIGHQIGEEGAMKITRTRNMVIRGNYVHHNWDNGIWFDYDNHGFIVEGNLSEKNSSGGIFIEIALDNPASEIRYNIARRNGYCGWFYGAQIQVSVSPNVHIHHNVVQLDPVHGGNIIGLYWQVDDKERYKDEFDGHRVVHNDITIPVTWMCNPDKYFPTFGLNASAYGFGMSYWGAVNSYRKANGWPEDTTNRIVELLNVYNTFLDTHSIVMDSNWFHVQAGDDTRYWRWPPKDPDTVDIQFGMNAYNFAEWQTRVGQDKNSTLDNTIDTTSAHQLTVIRDKFKAPDSIVKSLAKWLKVSPDIGVRHPGARNPALRALVSARYINGRMHVRLINTGRLVLLELYNAAGKQVMKKKVDAGIRNAVLDTRGLARGYYSLNVKTSSGALNKRVMIIQ